MIRRLLVLTLLVGCSTSQYAQQQRAIQQQQAVQSAQAAQTDAIDQIPAWYQMSKPAASRLQQLPQASPSYYERIEPTYEQRRGEQPTYERPGIQTNQYANYPSYQNRQPYENLNALTSGASLSNLQANRRYPSGASGAAGGSDKPYDSALKRYHKLLLKRRQWTTKIPRILASTTHMTPSTVDQISSTTTTTEAPSTTTKKMPKSLKSIYSTIIPKKIATTEKPTEAPATTTRAASSRITNRVVEKTRGTMRPHGTRKGWRMWKKVTPKYLGKWSVTTSEAPVYSTTIPTVPSTSVSLSSTPDSKSSELPLVEETEESQVTESRTSVATTTKSSTSEPEPSTTVTTTEEPTTATPTTTPRGSEEQLGGKGPSPLRYICRHKAGSNEHDPFSERRASTIGPFRPITVGHKWKPLRFKKPEPDEEVVVVPEGSNKTSIYTRPKGLRLLEYLLKQTDIFAKGLQTAIDGPNTELLAAIKDVVAKFKASLDEAGIDQDVRLMGNQLKNTWQQLRTGPMNEQIGRLFEKAVADAADQKTQQQIQKVHNVARP